jgi:hypothetical protein
VGVTGVGVTVGVEEDVLFLTARETVSISFAM